MRRHHGKLFSMTVLVSSLSIASFAPDLGPDDQLHAFKTIDSSMIEHHLCEDFIFALANAGNSSYISPVPMSRRGSHIEGCKRRLRVPSNTPKPLEQLLSSLIPFCERMSLVSAFVEAHQGFEYGPVSQVLTRAVGDTLTGYLSVVADLEGDLRGKGAFSLTELKFKLLGGALNESLGLVAGLVGKVWGVGGAEILDVFDDFLAEGIIKNLREVVFRAFIPEVVNWAAGATYPTVSLPRCLQSLSDPLNACAMNWRILRKIGQYNLSPPTPPAVPTIGSLTLLVENSLIASSEAVVNIFKTRYSLASNFSLVSKFFFIASGDWFAAFMDLAISELEKSMTDLVPHRVGALLDVAVRSSSVSGESVNVEFQNWALEGSVGEIGVYDTNWEREVQPVEDDNKCLSDLLGIRALTLDLPQLSVYPLSLVFNSQVLKSYKTVFRLLAYARWVDRKLGDVWLDFSKERGENRTSALLLGRMGHFSKNFIFFSSTVLQSNMSSLMIDLEKARTLQEIRQLHFEMIKRIKGDLLLTDETLFKNLSKILSTCALFSSHLRRFLQLQTRREDEKFLVLIIKFADTFEAQVKQFLKNLEKSKRDHIHVGYLLERLDFNGFFTEGQQ